MKRKMVEDIETRKLKIGDRRMLKQKSISGKKLVHSKQI